MATMLLAPTTARLPMLTPGSMTAFEPIQTWSSIITGSDLRQFHTPDDTVLVVVRHERVVPKMTVVANPHRGPSSNGCAVVDECMISDFDPPRSVCDKLDGHDRSVEADTFTKFHLAATRKLDAPLQSHRERHACLASQAQLSVHDMTEVYDLVDE